MTLNACSINVQLMCACVLLARSSLCHACYEGLEYPHRL